MNTEMHGCIGRRTVAVVAALAMLACADDRGPGQTPGMATGEGGAGVGGGAAGAGSGAGAGGTGDSAGGGSGGQPAASGSGGGGQGGQAGGQAGASGSTGTPDAGDRPDAGPEPGPLGDGFYRLERLDRGLVAVQASGGVYLGWRMFGYEYDERDAGRVVYHVERDGVRIATVADSTNHLDADGDAGSSYAIRAEIEGVEGPRSETAAVLAQNYLRIPLEVPPAATTPGAPTCETPNERYTYSASDASVGDADGDGRYEIYLKWEPSNAKDNSQSGCTGNVYIDAYELDGTRLFRIDLGINIRAGAHYTQFIVYDFDGDGRAELAVRTAPGTRDGLGNALRLGPAANDDDGADYRSVANDGGRTGYVLTGPEYLTVFDGATGEERASVGFEPGRGSVDAWGDAYGNRVDRFLATAAHLDDTGLASIVMARGYYTRSTLTAWNFRDGALTKLWSFDSDATPRDERGRPFTGQGAHSLSVADVDGDHGQEIVYGAMTVDHDGRGKCSTGLGHGDALHVSDFVPSRPGLEVFMPHENTDVAAYDLHDANTCEVLVSGPVTGSDTGRGVAADIDPGNPGAEMWASGTDLLAASSGQSLGGAPRSTNFLVWWDADDSRELEDGTSISEHDAAGALVSCSQCAANNGSKSSPALVADLLGDFREEVLWRETDSAALRLYTTTAPSERRIYTLMHDPQYRVAIAWQNVAYNQPPHPSFHIGAGMGPPPRPDIRVR